MTRLLRTFALALFCLSFLVRADAQSPAPAADSEASALLNLTKKIDEQNIKIDLLSQQILKLQQEIEHPPVAGVDHSTPGASAIPAAPAASSPIPAGANTHVVARGETLTSIARMHKVTVDELQKLNHIEDDRKLQTGKTLLLPGVPGAAAASPSPSPSASVPNE